MGAGDLRERIKFQSREDLTGNSPPPGGFRNDEGGWTDRFTVWARLKPLRGGEDVLAARLTGLQPAEITVRYSAQTASIATGWRAVDTRTGRTFAIKAIADFTERHQYLTLTVQSGGNDG